MAPENDVTDSKDWRTGPVGKFVKVERIDTGGTLQARRLSNGLIQFYWRYTFEGKTARVRLRPYDRSAAPHNETPLGLSKGAAVAECRLLAGHHRKHSGGYAGYLAEKEQTEAAAALDKEKAAVATALELETAHLRTVGCLLNLYVEHLKSKKRSSARDAAGIFRLHVPATLSGRRASDVTAEQITEALQVLVTAKKGRTANKLRAYLHAAYQCAMASRGDASISSSFRDLNITTNPVSSTVRMSEFDEDDKNPLGLQDLRKYWAIVKDTPGLKGATLRIHLLTGGQRLAQLVRLQRQDLNAEFMTLKDIKGRPTTKARKHIVPILPTLRKDFRSLEGNEPYVISSDGGVTALSPDTLSKWATEIAGEEIAEFKVKRVRSAVETELTAYVNWEVRAALQSHGLSGVQWKNYNGSQYLDEKYAALKKFFQLVSAAKPRKNARPPKKRVDTTAAGPKNR